MFDIGMTEILVIAVVAIVVVGPKDLPGLLRNGAKYLGQIRSMARDFQGQISEAIKETELDSVRDSFKEMTDLNPVSKLKGEVSDYMDSARAYDEPDEEYIAAGDKMAEANSEAATPAAQPASNKPAVQKPVAKKSTAQKSVTARAVAKKPVAKKASVKRGTTNKTSS